MADDLRLFIAIHIPEVIRERFRSVQQGLDSAMPKDSVRWTAFDQLHLTLEFLGRVPAEKLSLLERALTNVAEAHSPLRLAAESIGAFSSIRNPRVIWIGVTGDVEQLKELQKEVHGSVAQWEEKPETRAYRPHLTLGRVREMKLRELRQVSKALEEATAERFGEWKVEEFVLMQSKLSPHGAQHSVLATFPLQPLER